MSNITEKRYYIDPGKGEKKYTCPYSCYEDGRDAKEDIIPPKGYVLKGFKFEPHSSDKYYDGKLIAEYERAPFLVRLEQNKWKYIIALLAIGIIIAVLYILGVFSKPNPPHTPPVRPLVTTDSLRADAPVVDSTLALADSVINSDTVALIADNSTTPKDEPKVEVPAVKEEKPIQKEEATTPAAKEATPTVKETTPAVKEATPAEKENKKVEEQQQNTVQTQEAESPDNTPTAKFKQEFWKMIHNKNGQMNSYDALFNKYRGRTKCQEYEYLRKTILHNTAAFKAWRSKLFIIPDSDLQSITTIDALQQQIQ
jgi:hypothetical protein